MISRVHQATNVDQRTEAAAARRYAGRQAAAQRCRVDDARHVHVLQYLVVHIEKAVEEMIGARHLLQRFNVLERPVQVLFFVLRRLEDVLLGCLRVLDK